MRPLSLLCFLLLALMPVRAQEPDPAQAPAPQVAPAGDPLHPAIAVLPLQGQVSDGFGNPGQDVYQRVAQAFFRTKRFHLIERAQLGAVLKEGKFQGAGLVDESTAVALGKQVGAKFVLIGSYTAVMNHTVDQGTTRDGRGYRYEFYPAELNVNLRMVNVETGRIVEVIDAKGTAKEPTQAKSLGEVVSDLSTKLDREVANRYPLTGYVIKVLDEKQALIDLGKKDGLSAGDALLVFERGEDIVHPVTGKVIKGEKKLLTEFKVVSVDEESAVVKLAGARVPLKPGLALESKPKKRGFFEALNDTLLK